MGDYACNYLHQNDIILISLNAKISKADHGKMTAMPDDFMDLCNPSRLRFSIPGIIVVGVVYIVEIVDEAVSSE